MATPSRPSNALLRLIVLFFVSGNLGYLLCGRTAAPSSDSQISANRLARELFDNEIAAQNQDQSLWCYRESKEEDNQEKLLEVCQSKDGEIGRLLAVNGQELSAEQARAEDQRIQKLLNHPEQIRRKQKKEHEDARQEQNMLKLFPDAFIFFYEGRQGDLIQLKFAPNPNFRPASHVAQVFHHMEGSLLLDSRQKRLAEINGQLTSEVRFLGGLLGHLDAGGTFLVKQQDLGSGHWEMTTLDINMRGKMLFFKTISVREKETYTDFQQVPDGTTLEQAAELLKKECRALRVASK